MTTGAPENLLTAWARLLFDSLACAGVEHVIVSPGSRSTPFVLAAAEHPRLTLHDVVDERAAAFFALGQARVSGVPSVLLCTSGSAGAHYLPAVIEADQAGVPLLVLTADRPTELLHVAANQTIDQRLLFEGYTRRVVDVGAPDPAPAALRGLRRLAAQAVALTRAPMPGAVHVNVRARKPLEPIAPQSPAAHSLAATVREILSTPCPQAAAGGLRAAADVIDALAQRCQAARRGVIVAGPAPTAQAQARAAVARLQWATGFALFAEAASQLRFTGPNPVASDSASIASFDWLYRLRQSDEAWEPDLILQLGAPPTSASWERFLDRHPQIERVVIAPWGWPDPHNTAAQVIHADIAATCEQLAVSLTRSPATSAPAANEFVQVLAAADTQVRGVVAAHVAAGGNELSEAAAARIIVETLPSGAWLALGNSLPIRTVDAFCVTPANDLRVLSQRGASGIDGLIAGAAGAASLAKDPVVLLIGDVSVLHDISGLALGDQVRVPLVVVVMNNGGGRIFEQLPIARAGSADMLRHFTTPHERDFEHAARLYGHAFARVRTRQALADALGAALAHSGCTLIDAVVPPHGATDDLTRIVEKLGSDSSFG